MKLTKKSDKGAEGDHAADQAQGVHFPWDASLAGLNSGAYDAAGYPNSERADVDMPLAQSPAPGVDPLNGKETAVDGNVLTNVVPASGAVLAPGLPTSPMREQPKKPAEADRIEKPVVEKSVDDKGDKTK